MLKKFFLILIVHCSLFIVHCNAAVLSDKDAETYSKIFELQDAGKFDAAKKLEPELENDILRPDVLYQRYMAKDYHSTGAEIAEWMNKYPTHPGAEAIFKLAKKKKTASRGPALPALLNVKSEGGGGNEQWTTKKYFGATGANIGVVQRAIKKRKFKTAADILGNAKLMRNVDDVDFGMLAGRLAFGQYVSGDFDDAAEWGSKAAERDGELGLWTIGLLSFKHRDFEMAERYFERMFRLENLNENRKAEVAFWTGRAAELNGNGAKARGYWRAAATSRPASFYGAMSAAMLGRAPKYKFYDVAVTDADTGELRKTKYGTAAMALLEIGKKELAESHLKYLITKDASDGLLHAVHALSASEELPRTALAIAPVIKERGILEIDGDVILSAQFPLPQWEPRGGWNIDRALLFAIARQESRFKTNAKSRAGATGLLQLMPKTARLTASKSGVKMCNLDLTKAEDSMFLGQQHVRDLFALENVDNNIIKMLVSYNAGNGRLRGFEKKFETDDPLLYIESFPASETRQYVKLVMSNLWLYRARLGQPLSNLDELASGKWPRYAAHDDIAKKDDKNNSKL